MDENNRTQSAPSSDQHHEKRARVPYQRTVPHITQDPITDDGITYQRRAQREAYRRSGSYPAGGARLDEAVGQRGQGYRGQGGQEPAAFAGEARQQNFTSAPGRKHMGVATSDPQYLQPTGLQNGAPQGPAHPRHKMPGDGEPQVLHSDRYLSAPSGRKTIFTARQDRARRRTRAALVVALIVVVAILAWLIFFH